MERRSTMYLVQSNVIRHLSKTQHSLLAEMCRYSNNLYNVALYNIRQYYFETKKFLAYESNYHVCKENENYGLLQAGIAQQILKVADRSFKSFFSLVKKAHTGEYRFQDIRIPQYRKHGGMFHLVLSTNAISVKDGYFLIPVSRAFKKLHPDCDIKVPFPERLANKTIKEVRILPIRNGKCFKIQYVYEESVTPADVDPENILAIDIGVNNLASCITTLGTSFLLDGRKLKSINQGWNKEKARLQSVADKQGMKSTDRISRLTEKRNNRTKDILRKSARYILNYCIEHRIGTVVVGYNPDFKKSVNLGRRNNQIFTNISFGDFRQILQCLCQRDGIQYREQEESYTSQSSFLDKDVLPEYTPEPQEKGSFSGKRVKRGLYLSKEGMMVNADLNGAANILRKSKQNFDYEGLRRGLLASPLRIRLS